MPGNGVDAHPGDAEPLGQADEVPGIPASHVEDAHARAQVGRREFVQLLGPGGLEADVQLVEQPPPLRVVDLRHLHVSSFLVQRTCHWWLHRFVNVRPRCLLKIREYAG